MNKIISYLLIKCWNIFFPIFAIVSGVVIGLSPIICGMVLMKLWIFLLLTISIPLAVVIISVANNLTDWENIWEFSDFKQVVYEYQIKKRQANDNQ